MRGIGRQENKLAGNASHNVPVHGQKRALPSGHGVPQLGDDGGTAADIGGVIKDGIAQQDDMPGASLRRGRCYAR